MNNFDKSRRLLTQKQYAYVFEQAKKLASSHLLVLYRSNDVGYARLGLALSKRVISKAHDRNRLKRIVREAFRLQINLPPVDFVILARPRITQAQNATLFTELHQIWGKLSAEYSSQLKLK